jgi:hypothetical protein
MRPDARFGTTRYDGSGGVVSREPADVVLSRSPVATGDIESLNRCAAKA